MDTSSCPTFERFWNVYPRREAKRDAFKAWLKLKPTAPLVDRIVDDVEDRVRTKVWRLVERQFIPLPATYIRGERWEDERPKAKAQRFSTDCPHQPPCDNPGTWRCHQRTELEAMRGQL
jgi:hypothetical protein